MIREMESTEHSPVTDVSTTFKEHSPVTDLPTHSPVTDVSTRGSTVRSSEFSTPRRLEALDEGRRSVLLDLCKKGR